MRDIQTPHTHPSMQCRNMSFRAFLRMPPKRSPLVIADWDETITTKDTIALLAEAAYNAKPSYKPPFLHFVDVYMQASCAYKRKYAHPRTTVAEERQYQLGLHPVEMSSINEIVAKELFKGVHKSHFDAIAKKVELRDNFLQFLEYCHCSQIPVIVLSINWCRYFIEQVFRRYGFESGKLLQVVCNDFEYKNDICTGHFDGKFSVRTGLDKVEYLRKVNHQKKIIYIGDSSTDLFPLLESDVGVIIEGGSVKPLAENLGITVKKSQTLKEENCLFEGSWTNILNALKQYRQ